MKISSFTTPVTNFFSGAVATGTNAASSAYKFSSNICTRAYGYVSPVLQPVVAKVQSLNVSSVLQGATTFCKSNLGISIGLVGLAAVCGVVAYKRTDVLSKVGLLAASVGSVVFSATSLFKRSSTPAV